MARQDTVIFYSTMRVRFLHIHEGAQLTLAIRMFFYTHFEYLARKSPARNLWLKIRAFVAIKNEGFCIHSYGSLENISSSVELFKY